MPLLGGSPLELLHSHITTLAHWSSGLMVCFPPQGASVRALGVPPTLWNWDLLLALSCYKFLFVLGLCGPGTRRQSMKEWPLYGENYSRGFTDPKLARFNENYLADFCQIYWCNRALRQVFLTIKMYLIRKKHLTSQFPSHQDFC